MDPNRRSLTYAFSMTERDPAEYCEFRVNLKNLTEFFRNHPDPKIHAMGNSGVWDRDYGFHVRRVGYLGPNSPFAPLYRKGGERTYDRTYSWRYGMKKPLLKEHEAAWSVYVTPFAPTRVKSKEIFVKRDPQGRLHSPDGPAIQHSNLGFFFWHGTRVPAHYMLDPSSITLQTLFTHIQNAEQRRAATEIIGWDRLLADHPHRVIDDDVDPEIGTLIEVTVAPPTSRGWSRGWRRQEPITERFVRVRCGTGRLFSIPVPPTTRTALDAQAWMWRIPAHQFSPPEVRT